MKYMLWLGVLVAGCAVGPDYRTPAWQGPASWWGGAEADRHQTLVVGDLEWWKSFNDPLLDQLIADAIVHNSDVRVARARLLEARAGRTSANAELFPLVTAGASVSRGDTGSSGAVSTNQLMSIDASWELDLLGGNRRAAEAAGYNVQATDAARRYVLVSVLASVARNYLRVRNLQQQVEITRANLDIQRDTVRIVQAQYAEGIVSEFDVARVEAQRAATEASMTAIQQSLFGSINALAALVGLSPHEIQPILSGVKPIPTASSSIVLAEPAYVVSARPDVQQAERLLASATATQGVAAASWFPKLSLTGLFGVVDSSSRSSDAVWQAGGHILAPILDFGRVRAAVKVTDARAEAALATYEQVVNLALADIETALAGYAAAQRQLIDLRDAADANRRAAELAGLRYKEGISSLLDVLTVQQQKLVAESAFAEGQAAVGVAFANLYTAIGGGAEVANESR